MKSLTICLMLLAGKIAFGQLSGWTYVTRIVITETSGSTLRDYQTLVTLDTQTPIGAGKMKTDGSEIRFARDMVGAKRIISKSANYYFPRLIKSIKRQSAYLN